MQKLFLILFLFLTFLFNSKSLVFGQVTCPGICRSACQTGESQIIGRCTGGNVCCNSVSINDPCASACTNPNSRPCVQCLNNNPSSPSNTVSVPDPTCNAGNGIDTAIGCIPINDTNTFASWILGWAIGIGGGIAFLLIIYGSFMIMTSQGMPDRLKIGKEILTSAITGLIMLIFGILILNFIGFSILGLDRL